MPEPSQVHIDRALTNMSLQYKNEEFIWPMVMPVVKVGKRSDKYFKYDKDQRFRIVDDKIGPKGLANEVNLEVSTDNYSVADYALSDYVTGEEEANADSPLAPRADANDLINELLELGAEKRVADIAFNAANYPVGNKVQLSGTSQFGGSADDPIGNILTGLDASFLRPNTIIFGNNVWTKFRQLPEILDAVKSSTRQQGSNGGIANRSEIAQLFDVDRVIVGRGRYNTAKEGQAASYTRLWGNHVAMLHVKPRPTIRSVTFGVTFVETMKKTVRSFDEKRGLKGATYIKTGWNSDHKVIAADTGYFIEDAI